MSHSSGGEMDSDSAVDWLIRIFIFFFSSSHHLFFPPRGALLFLFFFAAFFFPQMRFIAR